MTEGTAQIQPQDLDRLREVASIGAGHAASALAALVGRTVRMQVPTVRLLTGDRLGAPFVSLGLDRGEVVGVFFEVQGGLEGVLALLLPGESCDWLLEHLTGEDRKTLPADRAESALREIGNILASHVVSSMADLMGVAVLPSVPVLALDAPLEALASLIAARDSGGPVVRLESELADTDGVVRAVLALIPDSTTRIRGR